MPSTMAASVTAHFGPGVNVVLKAAGHGAAALMAGVGVLASHASIDPVYVAGVMIAGMLHLADEKKQNSTRVKLLKTKVHQLSVVLSNINLQVQDAVRGQLENVVVALTMAANWYGVYCTKSAIVKTLHASDQAKKYQHAKDALDSAVNALQLDIQLKSLALNFDLMMHVANAPTVFANPVC